jgi:PAS domain S-box-containing protein/putative nucleotidyltransferase with HDIG domain
MTGKRQLREQQVAPDAAADALRSSAELRRRAEELLDGLSAAAASASPAPEELAAAVHELRVHQIELEMQNEELRRAQEALEAQREKYFELFDLAPVGYLTLSDKGIVGDANLTAAHLLGVERRLLVGRRFGAFVFGPDRAAYYLHQLALHETGGPQHCELRLRRGAEPFWAHLESRPQHAAGGEPLRYHLTFSDVEERARAAEALRKSEERYRSLFETMAEGVMLIAADGRLISVNPAAESILGLTRSEIHDLTNDGARWQLLRSDGTPMPEEEIPGPRAMREKRAVKDVVAGFPRPDGSVSWISVSAAPLFDAVGELGGVVVTFTDISELRRAGQGLLESLAVQKTVTEGVIAALALTVETRDPYTTGHQQRVGELAAAMALDMGLGKERAEGLRVAGMLHDVGKIKIPAEILSKPGLLSTMEFELIKEHAQAGYEILAAIHFPWPVAEMTRQHHERQDGSGYPRGLTGEDILPEARILAVADVVEAMASHRPYRPALGLEAALAEVRAGAGVRFDADAVAACEQVFAQGFAFTET